MEALKNELARTGAWAEASLIHRRRPRRKDGHRRHRRH